MSVSIDEIARFSPWLVNVHAFHWDESGRLPLSEGMRAWSRYFQVIAKAPGERYAMLEFVKEDGKEQFLAAMS